jgi:translation initiation factor 1 (eIF-1/SUI1)
MATKIYEIDNVFLVDDTEIYVTPLKIKYLRMVMDSFSKLVKNAEDKDAAVTGIMECVSIAMRQYYPSIKSAEDVEDSMDMETAYRILELGAGIKLSSKSSSEASKKELDPSDAEESADWDSFDLAKIESEVFLLGIWKDYEDLESSLSMPEIIETVKAKRESEYEERKFFAAIQGIDIEKENKSNAWEKLKAKVFSKGQSSDPNDIVSYQGANAQKAGFGIGMGLSYERIE